MEIVARLTWRRGGAWAGVVALALTLTLVPAARPAAVTSPVAPAGDVLILAAASLQTALDALVAPIRRATGVSVRVSYAASSALAKQVESGAPAGLFLSADSDWMDYLAARQLIRVESRVNLAGNTLVLIGPSGSRPSLKIAPGFPLAAALGPAGRLALANPDVVPAGKYAKAALTSLGVWNTVEGRIAAAENVRAALLLVSRGEAPLGVVYRTDALVDRGVTVVDTFPATSHPPIVYPVALTAGASPDAAKVLAFLKGETARAEFARAGFSAPK